LARGILVSEEKRARKRGRRGDKFVWPVTDVNPSNSLHLQKKKRWGDGDGKRMPLRREKNPELPGQKSTRIGGAEDVGGEKGGVRKGNGRSHWANKSYAAKKDH